jgi:hypothetical protein
MASDRCKCFLGARSFIYCIHHIRCEAQGGVGRVSLATKTFSARQNFAEAKKLDTEYEMSNKVVISVHHLTAHSQKQTLKRHILFHTNKTHLQKYGYSIYSNTVTIQKYLKE